MSKPLIEPETVTRDINASTCRSSAKTNTVIADTKNVSGICCEFAL